MVSRVACLRNRSLRTVRRRKSTRTTSKAKLSFQAAHYNPSQSRANSALCLPRSMGVAGSSSSRT